MFCLSAMLIAQLVFLRCIWLTVGWATDTGFELLHTTNTESFRETPLTFDYPLPYWLNGTLVRNGPGMFEVNTRKCQHIFDGFAKIVVLNFSDSNDPTFTTDFLQTYSYEESQALDDIAPYITFLQTEPEFNLLQRIQQMSNGMDNVNINVAHIGGEYQFMTDLWTLYSSVSPAEKPVKHQPQAPSSEMYSKYAISSSHPLPDDPSDPNGALINFYAVPNLGNHTIYLCKMLSSSMRTFFAEIPVGHLPYIHSLGATSNHIILFGHPLYINATLMFKYQEAAKSMTWQPEDGTTIYVINKSTGIIKTFRTASMFMAHYVNGYENASQIIADFVTFPDNNNLNTYAMDIFANSTNRNNAKNHLARIRRFVLDIDEETLQLQELPGFDGVANRLDLPVINENYRYKPYCYVYGVSIQGDEQNFSDFRLVKRDLCGDGDLWWGKPGFYPSEPAFIAKPGALAEDEGYLLDIVLDGARQQSYLAVLDARTMTEINRADLPTYIPFLLHGKYYAQ